MDHIDALIARFRTASSADRVAIKAELVQLCTGSAGADARSHVEKASRGEVLEVQWELEEVVEKTTPPKPQAAKEPEPPKKELPPDPNKPLTAADLTMVYDDPQGIMIHKSKVGSRWFLTVVDQRTGQPQTRELNPQDLAAVKKQLTGSPYWLVGGA